MEEIQTIWPQWKIVELIGQGAFGKVYKIKREELGNVSFAAVKIISLPQDQSEVRELMNSGMDYQSVQYYYEDLVKNLQNEIRVMETLKTGNNIVSIEDYAFSKKEDGIGWTIYIRMELLKNLNTYLQEIEQKITVEEVVKLGADICQALYCCEQSKVIHRDIKPDNVFRNRYGDYKLGDFGIAKQMEMTKSVYSQKGTSMYMAPEVYRGQHYDKTVDIYSLGIMLYKLLNYGRFPFMPVYPERLRPTDAEDAMRRRMYGEKLPVPALADARITEVIIKACRLDPKERYQSAREMRNALLECVEEKSIYEVDKNINKTNNESYTSGKAVETTAKNSMPQISKEENVKPIPALESTLGVWEIPEKETNKAKEKTDISENIGDYTADENAQKVMHDMDVWKSKQKMKTTKKVWSMGKEIQIKVLFILHVILLCWWSGKLLILPHEFKSFSFRIVVRLTNPDPLSLIVVFVGTTFICSGCLYLFYEIYIT